VSDVCVPLFTLGTTDMSLSYWVGRDKMDRGRREKNEIATMAQDPAPQDLEVRSPWIRWHGMVLDGALFPR
jgi:hypothetical protein